MAKEKARDRQNALWIAVMGVIGVAIGSILTAFLTPLANNLFNKSATATPSALGSIGSSGLLIPISNMQVDGKIIGDAYDEANFRIGEYELVSEQGENGYTHPVDNLAYFWESPGNYPELHKLPMRGIQATIKISPSESLYAQELIACHYELVFDGHSYNGMEHFIPFNQPVTLVWDFTGRIFLPDYDFSQEETSLMDEAADRVNSESSFTYYTKRNGELWQWQKLAYDAYESDKVQQVSILCNVSASEDYRGKAPGKQFAFKGNIMFGNVIVFPYEQP